MKKIYINPIMEIVEVEMQQHMLAGSTFSKTSGASDFGEADVSGGTAGGVTINSRQSNSWFDED